MRHYRQPALPAKKSVGFTNAKNSVGPLVNNAHGIAKATKGGELK